MQFEWVGLICFQSCSQTCFFFKVLLLDVYLFSYFFSFALSYCAWEKAMLALCFISGGKLDP